MKYMAGLPPAAVLLIVVGQSLALSGCSSRQAFSPAAAPPAATPDAPALVVSSDISGAVQAPDRTSDDRALDAGRHPGQTLAFFGIARGQRVAELGAGLGYTSELLARVVGLTGAVYAQNSSFVLQRFAEGPWTERLSKPVMKPVIRIDREFDDPLPPEAKDLDAVLMVLVYHDTVWFGTDRHRMNRAVFAALKPGGIYGIVDHAAAEGAGTGVAKTLHRIEEGVVLKEVEQAGFELDGEADFLKNSEDKHDWNASPKAAGARRGTSDRFVLRFRKPLRD